MGKYNYQDDDLIGLFPPDSTARVVGVMPVVNEMPPLWMDGMEKLLGLEGTIINYVVEVPDRYDGRFHAVLIRFWNGAAFFMKPEWLERPVIHCVCTTSFLMAHGCKCGAFQKEQIRQKYFR